MNEKHSPATRPADGIISRVDHARRLLAEACDAKDAKKVADMARAAEVYAKRQKLAEDVIAHATAIRVDAMTLMGEFLKAGEKNKGTAGQAKGRDSSGGSRMEPPEDDTPTLAEIGISKKESSVSQRLVDVRDELPQVYDQVRNGTVPIGKAVAAVRRLKPLSREKRTPRAVVVGNRLLRPDGMPFDLFAEGHLISDYLWKRVANWPESLRETFSRFVGGIIEDIRDQLSPEFQARWAAVTTPAAPA